MNMCEHYVMNACISCTCCPTLVDFDLMLIEKHGVVERCSFEEGLCYWMRSDVDTPGAEWVCGRGQEAWPGRGPPRDHTHNSAAGIRHLKLMTYSKYVSLVIVNAVLRLVYRYSGHYVMPGSHLTDKGQTSEILSRTLLPSTNCTVSIISFIMHFLLRSSLSAHIYTCTFIVSILHLYFLYSILLTTQFELNLSQRVSHYGVIIVVNAQG